MSLMTSLTLNAAGFNAGIDSAIKDTKDFQQAIGGASKETIKAFKNISEMGVGEMRKNLQELKRISFAGKSVEEIAAINKQIGLLTDEMGDLKSMQKGLGTEFGTLATKGIQGMAGLAEAGLGVAMVFGMDKKAAQEYQATMVGAMGAVQGLGEFQAMLGDKTLQSLVIRIKETAVTVAQTVATWAATAAQWALNASMLVIIGTIGAAVVIVGAIVAGLYLLVSGHNEAAEAAEKQGIAESNLLKGLTEMVHKNEQMLKLAKARGASEKELKQLEIGSTQQHLLGLKEILDAQLDVNGVMREGVDSEARQKMKEEFIAVSEAQEVMIVELQNMTDKKVKHTAVINEQTSAIHKWVEAQNAAVAKAKELSAFDVPIPSMGGSDVKGVASKGMPTKGGNPAILQARGQAELGKAVKKTNSELKDQMDSMAAMRDLMGGFGDAATTAFGEQSAAAKAFAVGQVIAASAMGIMGTWAGYAEFGPWGTALAIAQTAMIGALAVTQLGSIAGAFANGGIVGGQSYSGDNISARVNSGEMILNESQQGRLFAMANGVGGGSGGELTTRISGSDLVIVLNNHYKKVKNSR